MPLPTSQVAIYIHVWPDSYNICREDFEGIQWKGIYYSNLFISSSLSPSTRLCQILRNSLKAFLRYRVDKNWTDRRTDNSKTSCLWRWLSPLQRHKNGTIVTIILPSKLMSKKKGLALLAHSAGVQWQLRPVDILEGPIKLAPKQNDHFNTGQAWGNFGGNQVRHGVPFYREEKHLTPGRLLRVTVFLRDGHRNTTNTVNVLQINQFSLFINMAIFAWITGMFRVPSAFRRKYQFIWEPYEDPGFGIAELLAPGRPTNSTTN